MAEPKKWDAAAALAQRPLQEWSGRVWRMHNQRYRANDHGGALIVSGRYHRGRDLFPPEQVFAALYLSLAPEICIGEILRHVSTIEGLQYLNNFVLSELTVELRAVMDCRDSIALGLEPETLLLDTDYSITRELAAAAVTRGAEGVLVPSATRLGDNLIIFPQNLRPASQLIIVSSKSPRLYVQREPP